MEACSLKTFNAVCFCQSHSHNICRSRIRALNKGEHNSARSDRMPWVSVIAEIPEHFRHVKSPVSAHVYDVRKLS